MERDVFTQPPCLFEGAKEALDSAVLPGGKRRRPLMADAEDRKTHSKKHRGEDDLVVRAQDLGLAVLFDGVDQRPENGDGSLGREALQSDAGSSSVVDHAEHRLLSAAVGKVSQVEGPDQIPGHRSRLASTDVPSDLGEEMPIVPQGVGDIGLANGLATATMDVIEGGCDLAAPVVRHERLEPEHLAAHPPGLLSVDAVRRGFLDLGSPGLPALAFAHERRSDQYE